MSFNKENFIAIRKSLNLNQLQFGDIIGLTQQGVSDIERGINNPSKTLIKLLEYRYGDKSPNFDLKPEEIELIKALREIDSISRIGIYSSAINQFNEAKREKEVKKSKKKKETIESAIKEISKAISNY